MKLWQISVKYQIKVFKQFENDMIDNMLLNSEKWHEEEKMEEIYEINNFDEIANYFTMIRLSQFHT